jgi:hypothetical protein
MAEAPKHSYPRDLAELEWLQDVIPFFDLNI